MLRIRLVCAARDREAWVKEGTAHYTRLLSRYAEVKVDFVSPPKHPPSASPSRIRAAEADLLQKSLGTDFRVALSDAGTPFESHDFAHWIDRLHTISKGRVDFVIGGPYGLDRKLTDSADFVLSLSPLTVSHQLARIVLLEQLFRAFSILHHTDYHK
ncbi:MAG: 23S rRNA (pseudouridine(1915)-N(3))-methyltransferase RlmH [Candidatus Zixiibacteriota bacterium]|nr:MAG: 23S rRNA (pseudouridine(1915)-N(3))-methyltransferase RlmH [candidate division Zixibacteria bacterium]